MFRTSNPAMRPEAFTGFENFGLRSDGTVAAKTMTVQGTAACTAVLLGLCAATAVGVWGWLAPAMDALKSGGGMPAGGWGVLFGGCIGALVLGLIIGFKPKTAPYLAPVHALFEGAFVGGLSVMTAYLYPAGAGIVLMAGLLTFGILASLLLAYVSGIAKPSENFKLGVCAATGGVCLLMLVFFLGRMFLPSYVPSFEQMGWLGIAISGFLVVLASANLVLDFDFIEEGAKAGAPKHMEWYGAFGLLVTLVWLYVELLRLLRLIAASRE